MRSRVVVLGIALTAGLVGTPAAACPDVTPWEVVRGSLAPAGGCGAWVLTTNGVRRGYSYGELRYAQPITIPYEVSVTWQRLGADARSMDLRVLGASVLVGEERVALYVEGDDARFAADGWRPVPGLHAHDEHRVSVKQDARSIALTVDGTVVATWAFEARAATGPLVLGLKGAPGYRARAVFRDLQIAQSAAASPVRPR